MKQSKYNILEGEGTLETELCDIYRNATVSADIGYFERYRNDTYPTRPDHIRLIIN